MATANWRAYVAQASARILPVIRLTSPSGVTLYMSEAPFDRYSADLVRIGEVEQAFDEQSGTIPLPTMDFVHGNPGREFEKLLEGAYDHRGAAVVKLYASPDLDEVDWATEFTGVVDSWSYGPDGVTVSCKHDDGPLRNNMVPNLPIFAPEWGKVDLGFGVLTVPEGVEGLYIPLLYGIHDSTGIGGGGMVPTICVGFNSGSAEYLISLGELPDPTTNLTVYDMSKNVVPFGYASNAYRGGKTVTVFGFTSGISEDTVLQCDVHGYEAVGDGSGAVMTNPVEQLRHFLNLVYAGYRTGNWPTTAAPLNAASWNLAEAWASDFGLTGAAYIGGGTSMERASDIIDRWLASFPTFRLFWNGSGELECLIFDPTVWPGYPDTSSRRISTDNAIVAGSYGVDLDSTRLARRISSTLRYSAADGKNYSSVDVVDVSQSEIVTVSQRMDWASASTVDPVRQLASRQLRIIRRPARTHHFIAPFEYADLKPGETLYLDGGLVPSSEGEGLTRYPWDSRGLLIKRVAKRPSAKEVDVTALDPREMQVSFWTPGCTDVGASDENNGLAMIHQGAAPGCVRNQLGWVWRPGDQSFRGAPVNFWRINAWGIGICGGAGAAADGVLTWHPANNTFSQGTPPAATGWTIVGTNYTGLADGEFLFDSDGYRQSLWPEGTCYAYMTTPVAVPNGRIIRVYLKWADFVGEPKLRLEDTAAGQEWNFSTSAWGAGTTWYAPTNLGANGSYKQHDWHYEFWSEEIFVDASASPTLRLYVGNNTTVGATAYIICAAGFIVPDTGGGPGARPIRRDFVATTTTALAQEADIVSITNASGDILVPERGTVCMAFLPQWEFGELEDGQTKTLWHLVTDDAIPAAIGGRLFRVNAGELMVQLYAEDGISTLGTAELSISTDVNFLEEPLVLGFRWTGAAEEYDQPAYTLDVYAGTAKGTSAVMSSAPPPADASSVLYLGSRGVATPAYEFADGMISHVETRLFPMSDDEIARTLTYLSLPARPTNA